MFSKIVVGIDGSETSENAVKLACDLAQKYSSEIHLLHVPQPQTVAFAMGAVAGYHTATTMPDHDEVEKAGEKLLKRGAEIGKKMGQDVHHAHVLHGDPGHEITAYAEKCGADLIVSGRRGLGSVGALIHGSTSLSISHLAKCACLSVV